MVSVFFRVVGNIKFFAQILFALYIWSSIYRAQHIQCLTLIIVMAGTPPAAATAFRARMNYSSSVLEHQGCITALRAILKELFVNRLCSIWLCWCRGIVTIFINQVI
jgi:hypothetical protein